MTNEEIDTRLKLLSLTALPEQADKRYTNLRRNGLGSIGESGIAIELELLNMSMMAVYAMLGEIAKRLPEVKNGV